MRKGGSAVDNIAEGLLGLSGPRLWRFEAGFARCIFLMGDRWRSQRVRRGISVAGLVYVSVSVESLSRMYLVVCDWNVLNISALSPFLFTRVILSVAWIPSYDAGAFEAPALTVHLLFRVTRR